MFIKWICIYFRFFSKPIPNTVLLGAFVRTTGLIKFESIIKAIENRFKGNLARVNKLAAKHGYEKVLIKKYEV